MNRVLNTLYYIVQCSHKNIITFQWDAFFFGGFTWFFFLIFSLSSLSKSLFRSFCAIYLTLSFTFFRLMPNFAWPFNGIAFHSIDIVVSVVENAILWTSSSANSIHRIIRWPIFMAVHKKARPNRMKIIYDEISRCHICTVLAERCKNRKVQRKKKTKERKQA